MAKIMVNDNQKKNENNGQIISAMAKGMNNQLKSMAKKNEKQRRIMAWRQPSAWRRKASVKKQQNNGIKKYQ
jgi:hypothetical protein